VVAREAAGLVVRKKRTWWFYEYGASTVDREYKHHMAEVCGFYLLIIA